MKNCCEVALVIATMVVSAFAGECNVGTISGKMGDPLLVSGAGRVYLLAPDGRIAWEQNGCGNIHRVWYRAGKVYYSNGTLHAVDVVSHEDREVYAPSIAKEGLFGFEILKDGSVIVAENSTDDLVELASDCKTEKVRIKGSAARIDGSIPNAHHHYRMVRKSAAGTFIVCCSGANVVREYDKDGKLVWEQPLPALAFDVWRRANGNTLISHLDAVSEYTPNHEIVWSLKCSDLPELKLNNLCGIVEKKNGNLVIGTYANGGKNAENTTIFEVTRDKKVVWSYAGTDRSNMTAEPLSEYSWPVPIWQPTAADEDIFRSLIARKPRYEGRKKVLLFSRAFGFSHNKAMSYGNRAFALAASLTGEYEIDVTYNVKDINPEKLSGYDALLINNATLVTVKDNPGIDDTLARFVESGKGICLIHSAVDSFYDSEKVSTLFGGRFGGHPWCFGNDWRIRNERPDDKLNAAFAGKGASFCFCEEIYQQRDPFYNRKTQEVLLSLDMTDEKTRACFENYGKRHPNNYRREDNDFAVSWKKSVGKGRIFYTTFGHEKVAFLDERFVHILAGLDWVLGR